MNSTHTKKNIIVNPKTFMCTLPVNTIKKGYLSLTLITQNYLPGLGITRASAVKHAGFNEVYSLSCQSWNCHSNKSLYYL